VRLARGAFWRTLLAATMSDLPPLPMRRYRTVGRDLRYRSALQ